MAAASLLLSAVAVALSVLSYLDARRSAARSAARADEAVAAQKRMAEALEAQAKPVVAWEIRAHRDYDYLLVNTGTAVASGVDLDLGELAPPVDQTTAWVTFLPNETRPFMADIGWGQANELVTVTWVDDTVPGGRAKWQGVLPHHPPEPPRQR